MAHIIEFQSGDRRLQLGSEAYVRRIAFGMKWSYIRLGIRFSIQGKFDIGSPNMIVGLCRDANGHAGADRTSGACGVDCTSGTSPYWTLNARQYDTSYYQTTAANPFAYWYKLNTTITRATLSWGGGTAAGCAAMAAQPTEWFFGFQKDNNRITIKDICAPTPAQANSGAGKTPEQFLADMDNESMVSVPGMTRSTYTQLIWTEPLFRDDECYIFIYWNRNTPPLEISNIAVTRFS